MKDIIPKKLLKKYNKLSGTDKDHFRTWSSSEDNEALLDIFLENTTNEDDFEVLADGFKCTYLGGYKNGYEEGSRKRLTDIFLVGTVAAVVNYVMKRVKKYE